MPKIANIHKIEKAISKLPQNTIVRLGGMTDCFQPLEKEKRITLETIKLLNQYKIAYLIVTKSALVAEPEYRNILNPMLAHVQITLTTLDDATALTYEKADVPSERIKAILALQNDGLDVAVRLSPLIEERMDFEKLNALPIQKCIVEFLRVNTWIRRWFSEVDYSKYTLYHAGYYHLPLEEKLRLLQSVQLENISICEDVSEHYAYWQKHVNPNPLDCCNLQQKEKELKY